MLFYPSWGEGIEVQQTDMVTLDENRYKKFKAQGAECHSNNIQSALDLMKDACPKERKKLESFTKSSCKVYNKANGIRWRNPIVWKAEWNYKG